MRAVCYARVSSSAQRDRDTIDSQLRVLPEFVKRQNWTLTKTYVDDGFSAKAGKLEARRGLANLLADAARGLFDVVVVVDMDRLTRSEDLAERGLVLGAFQKAGVKIASASSGQVLDLSTSIGDLFGSLQAFYAAEENRKRSERVRSGKLTTALRGGKTTGRDPYGLTFKKPDRWTLHPEQAPVVRELFERVAAGEGTWTLAIDLNQRGIQGPGRGEWHRGRVYDLIRSRHAVGEYVAHVAQRIKVSVPPVITEQLWQLANDALAAGRKAALRRTKHVYLLEGLALCGSCGGRMFVLSGHNAKGRFPVPARYVCEHRKNRRVGPERCMLPYQLVTEVDERAWAAICRELLDPALPGELATERSRIAADQRDWSSDADGFRAHLERLDKLAAGHLVRFRRGTLTEQDLDSELVLVNRERAAVRSQLATAERAKGNTISAHARLHQASTGLRRITERLATATLAEKREIVLAVLNPGGARFVGSQMRLELLLERPANSGPHSNALADASF
jgi:site-specific DNA recombinase